jgi:acetyltransferase
MDIRKLLKPNKIAVVGASDKEGFGGDTCRNIILYMAEDRYYFINPKRAEVFGKPCYPRISALPEQVDLIVICTPEHTVEALLREGAACGVKAAVVYASGYGEIGTGEGRAKEAALKALCETLDIALMGPNCGGFVNCPGRVYPFAFISENRDRSGAVGVVSQSGQLVLTMMDSPVLKFSYAISAGNSKIVTPEDYLEFLVEDQDTRVIAMYLEGVNDPKKFIAALKRAAEIRKPIVVLKTGRSEKARAIAASHTGSLSGADRVFDAVFGKFGVIRVDDLEELMSTAQALAVLKQLPRGRGLTCISLSGGETGICADLAQQAGLGFHDFEEGTLAKLRELLPSYATPNNPLDATATLSYDVDKFAGILEVLMRDQGVDLVAVGYTLLETIADNAIFYMSRAMEQVSREAWAKPMAVIPFASMTRNREYLEKLEAAGVPVISTSLYSFKILKHILDFAAYNPAEQDTDIAFPRSSPELGARAWSGSESMSLVAGAGIECGQFAVASSREEAAALFRKFGGRAVAVKIDSPDIPHKTDAGCVRLNVSSEAQAAEAYDEVMENGRRNCPEAKIDGVLISVMAPEGTEMILGVKKDSAFGPCILCGLGGVFVEIFRDTALGLAPLSRLEAERMLLSLKGVEMLRGYRGKPKGDINALIDVMVKLSKLACERKDDLQELDINPVFVYERGIWAADALYIQQRYDS